MPELLRLATAGSVDDGKSTLIGRLLYDSKGIFEDQLTSVKKSNVNRSSGAIDFSLLTDGLRAEREQGITIDVAYRYFTTPNRKFIIADTPGHEQYTRNMATGASTADAATPYSQIAMQMLLLGGGLGLTIAPATEAIMGSLDADKAGIGSAVNDTTRELGGTLGVAIVGSVFASVYSGEIGSAATLAGLPADVHSAMGRSMAMAHNVIAQMPAERTTAVRDAVNGAFLDGLQVGSLVCAAIALGAAVVVAWLLPARAGQETNVSEINWDLLERETR